MILDQPIQVGSLPRFQKRSQWLPRKLFGTEPNSAEAVVLTESLRRLFDPQRLAYVMIAIGMVLQIAHWAVNRSFWQDELAVGLSIRERSFSELAKPLDWNQAAPIGFLWVEKLACNVLGDDERALRLFPLISGLAALLLANAWFRGVMKPWDSELAMGLFAIQPRLIEFAAELKPYSADVAAALCVLLIDLRVRRSHFRRSWLGAYILSGFLLPWFSFPVIFVLVATALSAGLMLTRAGQWRLLVTLACVWTFWAMSWGLQIAMLRSTAANEYLNTWWATRFLPYDRGLGGALSWIVMSWIDLFRDTLKTTPAWLAGVAAAMGLFIIVRQRPRTSWTIVGVLIVALIAAAWRRYPLGDRLALYLLPILAASLAAALASMARTPSRSLRIAAGILAIGLLGEAIGRSGIDFLHQGHCEESRPVLQRLAANASPEDAIYVYFHSRLAFDYYGKRFGLRMTPVFGKGIVPSEDPQLRKLLAHGRVWLFFAHGWKLGTTAPARNIQADFLHYADSLAKRIDSVEARGAATFLYGPLSSRSPLNENEQDRW